MKGLSERRRKFVNAYLVSGNATEAARDAGYKSPGVEGHRLLKNDNVQAAIAARQARQDAKAAITRDEVVAILSEHVRAALPDYLDDADCIDTQRIRRRNPHAIAELVQETSKRGTSTTKMKLHNPHKAAERLARMLGWDTPERHEHSVIFRDPEHDGL